MDSHPLVLKAQGSADTLLPAQRSAWAQGKQVTSSKPLGCEPVSQEPADVPHLQGQALRTPGPRPRLAPRASRRLPTRW